MDQAALTLALGAGMLAAINPCGFALLPAYLSLVLVGDDRRGATSSVLRALALTGAMTLGFVAVFAVFGLVISPVASSVQQYLPWFTLTLGLLLVVAGGWLLAGRSLPSPRWRPRGPEVTGSLPAMIGFGAAYAAASITCTIAPFLALVVTSLRSGSTGEGLVLFAVYALGMGLVVGVAAVAVALASSSLVGRMRRFGRWVPALAGLLLVISGGYVAYYGWWELRILDGAAPDDAVIARAQELRSYAVDLVTSVGARSLAMVLVVLVAAVFVGRAVRRRTG